MGKHRKWSDEFYITIYELAKSGMTSEKIASELGISKVAFFKYMKDKPAIQEAMKRGKEKNRKKGEGVTSFKEFVLGNLSPSARTVWKEIMRVEIENDSTEDLFKYMKKKPDRVRQNVFLYALIHCNFNMSESCRITNTTQGMLKKWFQDDGFAELLDQIQEIKKDFFEGALVQLVKEGVPSATIFANERYNRDRGYGNKVDVNVKGDVKHSLSVDDLQLSLSVKKQLLEAIRKKNQQQLEYKGDVVDAEIVPQEEE